MYTTPVIRRALNVAAAAHKGQTRKNSDIPFIVHPVGVMLVAAEFTKDEITLASALLHDVLEDCADVYDEQKMRSDFGDEITETVKAVSKDPSIKDWRAANENYLRVLRSSNNEKAFMICAADKICNLTDTLEDYEVQGEKIWQKFTTGKADQMWWYTSVNKLLSELLPEHPLVKRLDELISKLEEIVK